MLIPIIDIGSGLFTALAAYYIRPSAKTDEVYAAAVMLLLAGAAQVVAAGVSWADSANAHLFVSIVWATVVLAVGAVAWSRASRMDLAAAGDDEGDLW